MESPFSNWHLINKFENFVSEKVKIPFDFIHYSHMAESMIFDRKKREEKNPLKSTFNDTLGQKDVRPNIVLHDFDTAKLSEDKKWCYWVKLIF